MSASKDGAALDSLEIGQWIVALRSDKREVRGGGLFDSAFGGTATRVVEDRSWLSPVLIVALDLPHAVVRWRENRFTTFIDLRERPWRIVPQSLVAAWHEGGAS